jgi:histidinol-phosphatase (PHP family)
MNMILSSPHVHTTYCDGQSSVDEMVVSALDHGFKSIGFSGHARQDFDMGYCMSEMSEHAYIRDVYAARKRYGERIRIWLGMERDQWSTAKREPYDYVIGSVHYLKNKGNYIPVDGDPEALDTYCSRSMAGNGILLARKYYREVSTYISMYKPEIIGHFDVIRKNNTSNRYFDSSDPEYRKIVTDSLEIIAGSHAVMEVNTGGMARSGLAEPYPEQFALRRWHELGGDVILASDCHKEHDIAFGYEKGLAVIREAGYDTVMALGCSGTLFERCLL